MQPKKWHFVAIAHPNTESNTRENKFNDFIKDEVENMNLKGLPLLWDHSTIIGKIDSSWYTKSLGQVFIGHIDLDNPVSKKIYTDNIATGLAKQFSLSHLMTSEILKNGLIKDARYLLEVSVVKKGNREGCHLIYGITDSELEKKGKFNIIPFNNNLSILQPKFIF